MVGVVCRPGSPFLSDFFVKKQMNSSQKSSKKGLQKKVRWPHQIDIIQNRADPEQLRGRVLDSQNADTIRKNLQNVSPKQDPEFSYRRYINLVLSIFLVFCMSNPENFGNWTILFGLS